MNILHIINGLSVLHGGPSTTLSALVEAQVRRGDNVVVLSTLRQPPPLTLQPGQQGGLTVFEVPSDKDSKWYNPRILSEVRRWARDRDIVHVHGGWRYHLLAAAKVCRAYDLPYIIQPHGNLGWVCIGHKWYLKRPYFFLFERRVFNRADAILCNSKSELRQMARMKLRTRTVVVPNAVVAHKRPAQVQEEVLKQICPGLQPQHKVILYLGRIHWIKHLDALLDAFIRVSGKFPDWRLVLAGTHEEPDLVQQLLNQAQAHGIAERVMLPGTVLGEAKSMLFCRADIFALPSLHENFGVSAVEALFYGVPCVLSNAVALAADVAEGGAGLVCESNATALADSLQRLMGDPELRAQLARKAPELAMRYESDTVAAQLDVEYQRCINDRVQKSRNAPLH